MGSSVCFECGAASVHQHHLVPKSQGGTKVIDVCLACHSKIHGMKMSAPHLIKAGMQRAKEEGKQIGRAPIDDDIIAQITKLRSEGLTYSQIADELNISSNTAHRYCKDKE